MRSALFARKLCTMLAVGALSVAAQAQTNVTRPTDSIVGVAATAGSASSELSVVGTTGGANNYPGAESPDKIIDRNTGSKYLNFRETNVGVIVTLSGTALVQGVRITAGNDAPERDPAVITIEGTTAPDASTAAANATWTLLYSGPSGLAADPGRGQPGALISFANSQGFNTYRVLVVDVRNQTTANSVQFSELDLRGVLYTPGPVSITQQPQNGTNFVGQTVTFSVGVDGTPPYFYQWFSNGVEILNATNASYTTPTLTAAMNGDLYTVGVSNATSDTLSDGATLGVIDAPQLLSVDARGNPNSLIVYFSRSMGASALNTANYALDNGVSVTGASFTTVGATGGPDSAVLLSLNPGMVSGSPYNLTVTGVQDTSGNTLYPNPTVRSFSPFLGTYVANFSSLPPSSAIFGSTILDNGILKLTMAVNSQNGTFIISPFMPSPVTRFTARWRADISGGTTPPADGYSFVFSPATLPNLFGEEGAGNGLIISFDTYDNAGGEAPATDIRFGGVERLHTTYNAYRTVPGFVDVLVNMDADGTLDLIYDNTVIVSNLQTAFTPTSGSFGFAARTGGLNQNSWIDDLSIEVYDGGPIVITSDPASQSVFVDTVASFSVGFDGTPPYSVQWYSNNVPVSTSNPFAFTATSSANGAQIYAVVANEFSSATSQVATLTVVEAPRIVSIGTRGDPDSVYVQFSRPMDPVTALNTANYILTNDAGAVAITGASFLGGSNTVVKLDVPAMALGSAFGLTVSNTRDQDSNLQQPNPDGRTFTHGAGINAPAGLTMRRYDALGGDANSTRAQFAACANPARNNPNIATMEYGTNPSYNNTDGDTENYGAIIYGVFVAPTTGNYRFALSSDDQSQLWISSDANPANRKAFAEQIGWNGGRNFTDGFGPTGTSIDPRFIGRRTDPIRMVAGQSYYIEGFYHEGGGGDHMTVAVQMPGDAPIANGQGGIARSFFSTNFSVGCPPTAFFKTLGDVTVTGNANQTVNEGALTDLSIVPDGTAPYTIQWYSNGVAIAGANGTVYSFRPNRSANGAQFHAVVNNAFSSASSAVATLTVNNDVTGPVALRASGSGAPFTNVTIEFSEPVDPATATEVSNYAIAQSAGDSKGILSPLAIHSASIRDGTNVVLRTDPQTPGQRYTVTINNVSDTAGVPNPVAANSMLSFTAWVFSPGWALMELYNVDVTPGVNNINQVKNDPQYPHYPTRKDYITSVDSRVIFPNDGHEHYGGRISGLFIPAASQNYTFRLSHDDDGQVNGSLTDNPADAQTIINVPCCNGSFGSTSPAIPLTAGNRYYYEVIWKEGTGGDYGRLSIDGTAPIPGTLLGVYANPDAVSLVITQQPLSQTRAENQQAGLRVGASLSIFDGASRQITYQWFSNGVAIAGATSANYGTAPLTLANDGDVYSVLVQTPGASLLSSNAVINVIIDTNGPVLLSAKTDGSGTNIFLVWDEPVSEGSAIEAGNYYLQDAALNQIFIGTVTYGGSNVTLHLATPLALDGSTYSLEIDFQTDLVGNPTLASGMPTIDPVNGVELPIRSWVSTPCGGVEFTLFSPQSTGNNDIRQTLLADPRFPNNPTAVGRIGSLNSRLYYPDDSHEGYGARMRGLFIPPVSGNWIFYIRSDDSSILYLNPNGPSEAGKIIIEEETGCCNAFSVHPSDPYFLEAGRGYYIEMIYKEGTGGDYAFTAAKLQGQPAPTQDTDTIPAADMGSSAAPAGIAGEVVITDEPDDVSVFANSTATFSVVASNTNGLPICYQWRRNGVDIAGATGPSYTTPPLTLADSGTEYSVAVSIIGDITLSRNAIVTVLQDTNAPTVLAARAVRSQDAVRLTFNEPVDSATAVEPSNYTLTDSNGAPVAFSGPPTLSGDGLHVTLPTPALNLGSLYTLRVENVTDRSANPIVPTNITFSTWVVSRGFAVADYYMNIGGGVLVSDLTNNPVYPNSPTITEYVSLLESRTDFANDYGTRISGWLTSPRSGNHTFYISADDQGALFLSSDANPANSAQIAQEPQWAGSRQFITAQDNQQATRGNPPSNIATRTLTGGTSYYIQALNKEGGGGDNLSVAWRLPSGRPVVNGSTPIHGTFLSSLADPVGASVAITQQPFGGTFPSGAALLEETFTSGNGGFTVDTPQAYDAPWAYNSGTGSWIQDGQGPDNGHPNTSRLTSPAINVTASGPVSVRFTHRHSFEHDGTAWDGGQVQVSVNGGPFTAVPAAAFSSGGYNGSIAGNSSSILSGQPGFVATSAGHGAGTLITSVAYLGSYNAGDAVQVRFVAGNDTNTKGATPNWEVSSVEIGAGHAFNVTLVAAASGTSSASFSGIVYQWQSRQGGPGNPWLDIIGANSSTYSFTPAPGWVADYRVLAFVPGASATSASASVVSMLRLIWTDPGVLQYADQITGPWQNVPGNPTSPLIVDPRNPTMRFYRLSTGAPLLLTW